MTQYTFQPDRSVVIGGFADWGTAASWSPQEVPDSPDADVVVPPTWATVPEEPQRWLGVVINAGEIYVVHSLAVTGNAVTVDGALSVGEALALSAGTAIH